MVLGVAPSEGSGSEGGSVPDLAPAPGGFLVISSMLDS